MTSPAQMPWFASVWIALCAVVVAGCEPAAAAPSRGGQALRTVEFVGDAIAWMKFEPMLAQQVGVPYQQDLAVHDAANVRARLVAEGYLDADVRARLVGLGASGAHLEHAVTLGPRYRLRAVTLAGASKRIAAPRLGHGDEARAADITRALELATRGQAVSAHSQLRPSDVPGYADLTITIEPLPANR